MPLLEIYERTTVREIPIETLPVRYGTTDDPFAIDHDCDNPCGHQFAATCSDVVCVYCGRIAWA